MYPILKPNTNAQRSYFLSHLLRSLVHLTAPNCLRYLHSSKLGVPVPSSKRVSPPDPRPEAGPEAVFRFLGSGVDFFLGIHCKARVGSGRRRRSVAKGWGPGTRERQHASRDTIQERWGERTHPRTQAQLSLNRSARLRWPLPGSNSRPSPRELANSRLPTGVYM